MQNKKSGKKQYRVRNWPEYDKALVQRGSLEIWLDEDALDSWRAEPSGESGAPRLYADSAIVCTLTVRNLFHLPLRACEGFLTSVFKMSNVLLPVPDYSTISRRSKDLPVALRKRDKEKTVIIVDSTGVKVYGEGEWKVRQHGASKRRTWKKLHIAIDENGEIRATEVTGNDCHDSEAAKSLLSQEEATIEAFAGDGAYDRRRVYDALRERGVQKVLVPPQKNAKIWFHGNRKAVAHARDENLRTIRKIGRKGWKEQTGYHIRSGVETTMFRFKTIFGDRFHSREWGRQVTELLIRCNALNRMLHLGMPESYAIA